MRITRRAVLLPLVLTALDAASAPPVAVSLGGV